MSRFKDIAGDRFGNLTAIKTTGSSPNKTKKWLCKCDCGREKEILSTKLRNGSQTHCGCKTSENTSKGNSFSNVYETHNEVTYGFDNRGNRFIIDTEDLGRVSEYYWGMNKRGYFQNSKNRILLHRFVLKLENNEKVVDHLFHDTSDNRKSQIRICTQVENMQNSRTYASNTSTRTGVYPVGGKYRAKINVNKKEVHLGMFERFEDAVEAREKAEKEYYYKIECWN